MEMKNFQNRCVAFLLALCMLLSVLPPVVMATDSGNGTPTEPVKVVYDFTLANMNTVLSGNYAGKYFYNTCFDGTGGSTSMGALTRGLYSAGTLNWKPAATNAAVILPLKCPPPLAS